MKRFGVVISLVVLAAIGLTSGPAAACPFCTAQSLTLGQEIGSADVAVLAKLVSRPKSAIAKPGIDPPRPENAELEKAKFECVEVLKGEKHVSGVKTIEVVYFGDASPGAEFLLIGFDAPKVSYSSPIALGERGAKYIKQVVKLPEKGAERLAFFQEYLEDKEALLARDAYDEFARAPYSTVKELRPKLKHEQLVNWIKSPEVTVTRRRLYLTLLSVCADKNDVPMLEKMLRSNERQARAALDALVSCYMSLKGTEAMPLVDELFMKNAKADYADTYSVIMAIRFQGEEGKAVPRERLLESLRHVLRRPQLADMVIPDLARWEDWSVMAELAELFEKSNNDSSWVRMPIVNYFRACPKPEAKKYLDRLAKIDPETFKRANTFFPVTGFPPVKPDEKTKPGEKAGPEKSNTEKPSIEKKSNTEKTNTEKR